MSDELREAARAFDAAAERAERRSLKDLLAPAAEALADLAGLADPTPEYVPDPTGSRRRQLMDAVRAKVTSGLAPAVRAVLERQAKFNEQIAAVLLDVVRRLQSGPDLAEQIERLERRIAALEGKRPAPAKKKRR
jgi:hypothetical protein